MRPEVVKYLEDVRQACGLLEDFIRGRTFAEYDADALLRSAVERQFITIGEALIRAAKIEAAISTSFTAFREIVGFRNILVHGYAVVQNATVWGILENDLPVLTQEVSRILAGPNP